MLAVAVYNVPNLSSRTKFDQSIRTSGGRRSQAVPLGLIIQPIFVSETTACAQRTGAAASLRRRQRDLV